MKKIQENLINFIEKEQYDDLIYQQLLTFIDNQEICKSKNSFKAFLYLISKSVYCHHQASNFIYKIEKILKSYEKLMQFYFTNYDIFNIFKNNKRILLYLFEEKIIIPDKSISNIILSEKYKDRYYPDYFFREFNSFYDKTIIERIKRKTIEISENNNEQYEEKRKNGQNHQFICELIRNDSINEFISHVNHNDISLTMKIEISIYETNWFLADKSPTLIEYAAYFGSIKIIKYLYLNKVKLTSSLWIYAIHSGSSELIHLLEENGIVPINKCYCDCLKKAIKCNYNDLAQYIMCNLFEKENEQDWNILTKSLQFYNFSNFVDNETNDYLNDFELKSNFFYDMCKYDHFLIVDFLLKNADIDINAKMILMILFLNEIDIIILLNDISNSIVLK